MDIQNLLMLLQKLFNNSSENSQNAAQSKQQINDFDSSFFSLPNYDINPQKTEENNDFNSPNNTINLQSLVEIVSSILPLLKPKQKETKKEETIPSYINRLHKIDE